MQYADQIKEAVTMRDACDMYGVRVTRFNKALCPFHEDKKPSMHIYPRKGGFYCFVCDKGGSVIDFTMGLFGLEFRDAVKKLNEDFNLGLPIDEVLTEEKRREANRARRERQRKQEMREKAFNRLYTAFWAAYNKYTAYDLIKLYDAPEGPYDEPTPQYVRACKNIDAAWEDVQEAAERLREFEKKDEEG